MEGDPIVRRSRKLTGLMTTVCCNLVLGREHYERREYDLAEHALRQIIEKTGRFDGLQHARRFVLHERGDSLAAEAHFERAVQLNEHYTEAPNLAVTYNDSAIRKPRGRSTRIRRGEGEAASPTRSRARFNMHANLGAGVCRRCCAQERTAELTRAVALCPTFVDLQLRLGTMYRDAGNLALAREHYAAARDANPKYAPARVLLGVAEPSARLIRRAPSGARRSRSIPSTGRRRCTSHAGDARSGRTRGRCVRRSGAGRRGGWHGTRSTRRHP